jgi:hypothetical protein
MKNRAQSMGISIQSKAKRRGAPAFNFILFGHEHAAWAAVGYFCGRFVGLAKF